MKKMVFLVLVVQVLVVVVFMWMAGHRLEQTEKQCAEKVSRLEDLVRWTADDQNSAIMQLQQEGLAALRIVVEFVDSVKKEKDAKGKRVHKVQDRKKN